MSELVNKLTVGKHPVEAVTRPEQTTEAFKESIRRGYVHVKFIDTLGGTELGIRLGEGGVDFRQADLDSGKGEIALTGSLTLDYVPVKCFAVIELSDLKGYGWLERGV